MSILQKIIEVLDYESMAAAVDEILCGLSDANCIRMERSGGWERLISIDSNDDLAEIVDSNRYTGETSRMALAASDLLYADLA